MLGSIIIGIGRCILLFWFGRAIGKGLVTLIKYLADVDIDPLSNEDIQKSKKETRKQRKERERREAEQKAEEELNNIYAKRTYDRVWNAGWKQNGKPLEIRDIPQLSFEQWLIFYKSAPEHWKLNFNEWDNKYCVFPNYQKGKIDIDIFWETPQDLDKFFKWQENEYRAGNAAIFEQKRAERLSKLTKALQEDMKQKHEQAQKEIAELEKQIAASMPPREEDPIQKCLREQRQEKAEELNNFTDLITHICNKYPDYQYAGNERLLTGDGTMITEVTLVHRHKPGNFIRETYFYDEKAKTWCEKQL